MKIKNTKLFFFILGLFLIIPTILPFFDSRIMTFHDETQFANLHQYIKAISLGQFPPRWAPDMQFTYGSPFLEFNYQLPYYLAFLLSKIGLSLIVIFKVIMASSLVLAFIGFYLLILDFSSPAIALVSSVIYTYTPYRAVNVYVRGSIGESMAFAIFPFILLYLFRLKKKPTINNFLLSAVFIALLFLNHQPATVLTLPFIFFLTLSLALKKGNFKSLIFQILNGILALILSAYYWVPVILEQKFLKSVSPFNFYDHFPFIKQLIYSPWGYGASVWGPYDGLSFQLGILNQLFLLASIIILLLGALKVIKVKYFSRIAVIVAVVFVSLFLMNMRSVAFWNVFPFTQQIQFPWRLLMVPALFTSFLSALVLHNLKLGKKFSFILYSLIIISAVGINMSYFRPGELFQRNDSYFLRRFLPNQILIPGEKISAPYLQDTEDYVVLPKWATRPTSMPDGKFTSSSDMVITYAKNDPFDTVAKIESFTGGFVTINNFYFPGWVITLDGKVAKVNLDKYGAMVVFVERGTSVLEARYLDTPARSVSNIISLTSFISVCILLIYYSIRRQSGRPKYH